MLSLYVLRREDLWFRQKMLADEATMSYNHAWGGTIDFPEENWDDWYDYWIAEPEGERFYRYLQDTATGDFVGEIAYHSDGGNYIANIIIHAQYRGKGYGREGLKLLCEAAANNGIKALYDDIATDNTAAKLFLELGFAEEYRTEEIIMLKKEL